MRICIHLFSVLRDCLPPGAERGRAALDMPEGATLADLIIQLGIDEYLGISAADLSTKAGWQVMVSGRHEPNGHRVLREGEEVKIFPPVAGG